MKVYIARRTISHSNVTSSTSIIGIGATEKIAIELIDVDAGIRSVPWVAAPPAFNSLKTMVDSNDPKSLLTWDIQIEDIHGI